MSKNSILIATHNPHKEERLRGMVEGYFDRIDILRDMPQLAEAEEQGDSFSDIASAKAKYYSALYGGYAISSDSGVEIPALGKNWNALLTRRFIGRKDATDFERLDALLELMKEKDGDERISFWHEAVAIAKDGQEIFRADARSSPTLIQRSYDPKKYREGIWLCSLFYYPKYKKNFFDLTPAEIEEEGEDTWVELKATTKDFLNSHLATSK